MPVDTGTVLARTDERAPLKRDSLTEQTARGIREAILSGDYALGQKIRESEVAARFQVSSSVIREALHTLQGEGIIVTKPYCGRSVFKLGPEEVAELVTVRASLESYAAYLAAQKMNPQSGKRILAGAEHMLSRRPANYHEWVVRELEFHRAVWDGSGNELLIRQLGQLLLPMFTLRILQMARKDVDVQSFWKKCVSWETATAIRGHQALARAIVAGDAARARSMMIRHILPEADATRKAVLGL